MLASEMATRLGNELKDLLLGNLIYDWINRVQEDIDSRCFWTFLEATPYTFAFLGPYTTGTASVTNGSTAVTGSGTTWTASHVTQMVQFDGDNAYYFISAVPGATSLTLSNAYIGTTAAGVTYSIYNINYSLPTGVSLYKIKSLLTQNPHRKLFYVDEAERDEKLPNYLTATGVPYFYSAWGQATIQPVPIPDQTYNAVLRYQKLPTIVDGASANTFDFPQQMHNVILQGALHLGWLYKDDLDMAAKAQSVYEAMLRQAIRSHGRRMDSFPVMRRFDEPTTRYGFVLPRHINSSPFMG